MAEQDREQRTTDLEELESAFRSLNVRGTGLFDFIGSARVSPVIPTNWSWARKKPQKVGASIRQLLDADTSLHIYSLSNDAIQRRERVERRLGTLTREISQGGPIHHARVIDVTDIDVGMGRELPLLTLEEFNNPPPEQNFVISVAEMARYVQDQVVELDLR